MSVVQSSQMICFETAPADSFSHKYQWIVGRRYSKKSVTNLWLSQSLTFHFHDEWVVENTPKRRTSWSPGRVFKGSRVHPDRSPSILDELEKAFAASDVQLLGKPEALSC